MKLPLPPMKSLRAFEASARLMSFTAAADELCVTQVAVSRQVRGLEDFLGVELFDRRGQSIALTKAGSRYYPAVRRALNDLAFATSQLSRRGQPQVLSILAYNTFAQCWLIPMLPAFHEQHPAVEIRLSASSALVDFNHQDFDAAIRFGVPDMPGIDVDMLAPIELVPVMSPDLLAKTGGSPDVSAMLELPLLHSLARPGDWDGWFRHAGLASDHAGRGHKFESSLMAYEAAIRGLGVALGVRILVEGYLASGQLVAPFDGSYRPAGGYFLVHPKDRAPTAAFRAFRRWLLSELGSRADDVMDDPPMPQPLAASPTK